MGTSILADSYIATGQAVAFNEGMSPERMAERSTAYSNKEAQDQKLRTLKATEPTEADRETLADTQTIQLQNTLEAQKQMLLDNNKQKTFTAYERYDADSDVRHLNTMLTDLESTGSKLYGKIARVDKLTEEDRQMMEDMGIPSDLVTEIINNPELNKSYVKITQKDGSTSFGDLDVLKGLTGYNDYASQKELVRQKTAREIEMMSAMGYDLTPAGREAFRRTKNELGPNVDVKSPQFQEALTENIKKIKLEDRKSTRRSSDGNAKGEYSGSERDREARRRARIEGLTPYDPEWDEAVSRHLSDVVDEFRETSASRNVGSASTAEDELLEMGFMEMDIPELTQTERVKIEQKIRTIEELGGAKLDATTKKNLTNIRKLTSLGELGSDLTDQQTGLIDNVYRLVKRYVTDNVEGVQAASAYSHFRNLAMNALYGGQLTPNEAKQFRKAFGSLAQQRGPVLAQFRVALQDTKDSYEAIVQTENDMVIKWRTGQTGEDLYNVIDSLDDRIRLIDDIAKGKPITTINPPLSKAPATVISPEDRAILEEIYGDN